MKVIGRNAVKQNGTFVTLLNMEVTGKECSLKKLWKVIEILIFSFKVVYRKEGRGGREGGGEGGRGREGGSEGAERVEVRRVEGSDL